LEEDQVLVPLFVEDPYVRTADIVNDNDDECVLPVVVRPKRNAPIPAQYLSRIYAVSVDNDWWDDVADISCYRYERPFAKELLEMDKEEKRLAVLEASDQERLMRQEAEDLESGGHSEGPDEYSDSRSAATDKVIYHRLLDSFDAMRSERDRILQERTGSVEDLTSSGGELLDVIPETQEERGRKPRRIAIQDGQVRSDSDDKKDGGTPFPRGGGGARLDLAVADDSKATGRIEEAKKLGVASFMDAFSPRMALAGFLPGHGIGGTEASPKYNDRGITI